MVESEFDPDATFPSNHAMRGTKIMEGHGVMRVTAVGDATENGKVYEAAQVTDDTKTPLDEQFERLGKLISIASYVIGALIIVGRIVVYLIGGGYGNRLDEVRRLCASVDNDCSDACGMLCA